MMLVIESLLRSRSRVSAIDKHEKSDDRMWNRIRLRRAPALLNKAAEILAPELLPAPRAGRTARVTKAHEISKRRRVRVMKGTKAARPVGAEHRLQPGR